MQCDKDEQSKVLNLYICRIIIFSNIQICDNTWVGMLAPQRINRARLSQWNILVSWHCPYRCNFVKQVETALTTYSMIAHIQVSR